MNLKKLFASALSVLMLASMVPTTVLGATYSAELEGAYEYAFDNGITTMTSIENANMYGSLTRVALAKMVSNYAMAVLGLTPDTDKDCEFSDVSTSLDNQYDNGVTNACQLGLMGVDITKFRPFDTVTRAEFGTVLSRALRGDMYNGSIPYYADHLEALKDAGIMSQISNPNMTEVRGYVMLMMQRADEEGAATPAICQDPMVQIACALNQEDDACPVECRDIEEDDEDIERAGTLEVSLSNDTPDGVSIPSLAAGVNVAEFDFEAGDDDITLNSLVIKRVGLGGDDSVTNIALFGDDGRITKAKTFNTSTDEATLVFSPALEIKAGGTETLKVIATIGGTGAAGDKFAMQIKNVDAVDSTAEDVDGSFPITAETMEVASVTAGTVKIETDGTPADVKLGEKNVEILKFKLSESSSANEDIEVSSITFKEVGTIDEKTELENFRLYVDGEEVAKVNSISDKYVTFNFDEVTIKDGNNKKFSVKADIIGGAAKTIDFELENDLDITAVGTQYGYGAQVTGRTAFNPTFITVDAGEVTVTYTDPASTEVRRDKDNVELGRFTVTSAAGKDLEIQEIRVVIDNADTTSPANISTLLENVELYDTKAGTIYDLTSEGAGDPETFSDTSVTIPVGTSKTFAIRVDTKDVDLGDAKFVAKLQNLGSTASEGLDIRETDDDTQVTDITPSSITFRTVNAASSTATLSIVPLSATYDAVVGSKGVETLTFELKASDASDLEIDEIKVERASGTAVFNNAHVSKVSLYEDSIDEDNLLDSVGGSSIATEVATFNGFNVNVEKNTTKKFYVTIDIVDDATNANDTLQLGLNTIEIEDEDNDQVYLTGSTSNVTTYSPTPDSARVITYKASGTLTVNTDNTDTATNKDKNVLGNTTSDRVASYEFIANNEDIEIEDLQIVASGTNFVNAVSQVILYANDKTTEVARKTVTSNTVLFDDVNYVATKGTNNLYIKVITRKIGQNQAGTQAAINGMTLEVTKAEGVSSKKLLTSLTDGNSETTLSKKFDVLPVMISNVAFVASQGGFTRNTTLVNGENTLAIVAITTNTNTNTDTNGGELKSLLSQLKLKVSKYSATTIASYTLERIDGTDSTIAGSTATTGYVVFTPNSFATADDELENGATAYYVVKATVTKDTGADNDDYVKLHFDGFNAGQVTYAADDTGIAGYALITDLRIGLTQLDGTQINE